MLYIKYVLIIIFICCCLMSSIRTQSSSESEGSDYEQDEDEEFNNMLNEKDDKKGDMGMGMMMNGRAREAEYDEFENFNEEIEKDKFGMEDKPKNKEDIEFAIEFGHDKDDSKEKDVDSKETDDKDGFYQSVNEDLDQDFNIDSSNKFHKRVKCDNRKDCEENPKSKSKKKEEKKDDFMLNRSLKDEPVSDDKTTIVYLNDLSTDTPLSTYPTSTTTKRMKYPQRQYEEATNLRADHHQEDDHWSKPLQCECDVKAQPKIIGGSNAAKNKYPFAVAIFTLVGRGSFCGATIVNDRYVLTASHCVQRHYRTPRNYNIVAGRTDLNISDILEDFITKASHIWLNGRLNDVALVRLAEPLEFSPSIKPACFGGPGIVPKDYSSGYNKFGFDQSYFNNLENVSNHFKKTNRTLTAIGWGYVGWKVTKVNGVSKIRPTMTTKLQEVELNEVICTKEEYLICVEGNNKSPCFGDSGSPLLYNHYEKMVVVGLTSRSSSSKAKHCLGAPTIYERSAYYLPWIKTLTSNRICIVD